MGVGLWEDSKLLLQMIGFGRLPDGNFHIVYSTLTIGNRENILLWRLSLREFVGRWHVVTTNGSTLEECLMEIVTCL